MEKTADEILDAAPDDIKAVVVAILRKARDAGSGISRDDVIQIIESHVGAAS